MVSSIDRLHCTCEGTYVVSSSVNNNNNNNEYEMPPVPLARTAAHSSQQMAQETLVRS